MTPNGLSEENVPSKHNSILDHTLFALIGYAFFFFPAVERQWSAPVPHLLKDHLPQVYFASISTWLWWRHRDRLELSFKKRHAALEALCGALPMLSLCGLASVLQALWPFDSRLGTFPLNLDPSQVIGLFILAPMTEEIFFRGILFNLLKKRFKLPLAMAFNAAVFASCHSGLFIGTAILSLLTCWIYHKHRSLAACIGMHAASNALLPWISHKAPNVLDALNFLTF